MPSNVPSPELDWGSRAWRAPPAWIGRDSILPLSIRRNTAITREKSGRLDLNQRPFGPQPKFLSVSQPDAVQNLQRSRRSVVPGHFSSTRRIRKNQGRFI